MKQRRILGYQKTRVALMVGTILGPHHSAPKSLEVGEDEMGRTMIASRLFILKKGTQAELEQAFGVLVRQRPYDPVEAAMELTTYYQVANDMKYRLRAHRALDGLKRGNFNNASIQVVTVLE